MNIEEIEIIAKKLQELELEVYFIGGSVAALYADDIDTFEQRITRDIDVVIEVINRGHYYLLQERLREAGFNEDSESEVICRWIYQGIIVDIMPNDERILGFSNVWYSEGIKNSKKHLLQSGRQINIFSFPYFIATKLEALKSRGEDLRYSKDFEDIVRIIDNKSSLVLEFSKADVKVIEFIKSEFSYILKYNKYLTEAILCVLFPETNTNRSEKIIQKMKSIIET